MIAGVIAQLNSLDPSSIADTIQEIESHPQLDSGNLTSQNRLPVTIDSPDQYDLEAATDWLRSRRCVDFVDVVFVHFDNQETEDQETG